MGQHADLQSRVALSEFESPPLAQVPDGIAPGDGGRQERPQPPDPTAQETEQTVVRLLVADDKPSVLESYRHVLSPDGHGGGPQGHQPPADAHGSDSDPPMVFDGSCKFDLVLCEQGDEALEAVRQSVAEDRPFAAAFLDVRMPPGPDGVEVARAIRELDSNMYIVLVTAYQDYDPEHVAHQLLSPDRLLYLQKPFDVPEIRRFAWALSAKWRVERHNRQIRQDLKRARDEYLAVTNLTGDVIVKVDEESKLTFVNDGACAFWGESREELLGRDFSEYLHPDDVEETDAALQSMTEAREMGRGLVNRQKTPRGWRVVEWNAVPKFDEAGDYIGMQATGRDITERRQAQRQLAFQNALLQAENEASIDGILVVDEDLQTVSFNHRFAEMWRIPDEILENGSDDQALEHAAGQVVDSEQFMARAQHLYDHKNESSREEIALRDGRTFERYSAPVKSSSGEYFGRVWYFRDISERQRTLEALRESEARFRELAELLPQAVWEADAQGNFTFVNQGALAMFGYEQDDLEDGVAIEDVIASRDREKAWANFEAVIGGEQEPAGGLEYTALRGDGSEFPMLVYTSAIVRDGTPVGMRGLCIDITDRKQAEKERQDLQEQLFEAQKLEAMGTLAGGVAHDFNNLLTGMIGMAELALRHADAGSKVHEYVSRIPKQGERAADLISSLLAFSRQSGTESKPIALMPLVKETVKMLKRTLPESLQLQLDWPGDLPAVSADATQIQQVIINLATNARDAMPDGGQLTIELADVTLDDEYCRTHADASSGQHVCICVRDTGSGISEDVQERMFEPFYTTKQVGEGTGLGLAMVYGIVKEHNGHIEVDTQIGEGTEFRVYLPAVNSPSDSEEETTTREMPEGGETILVVEDDPTVLLVAREMLESLGYTVLVAPNAEEGLAVYRDCEQTPDLVLTDMTMPGRNAEWLHSELSKIDPSVKTVLMTGYALEEKVSQLKAQGTIGFVQKPLKCERLAEAVRTALDS